MRKGYLEKLIRNTLIVFMAALIAPCYSGASENNEENKNTRLEEIVVKGTAYKKEGLNLDVPSTAGSRLGLTSLETPASVDAVPREIFVEQGLFTINDAISRNAPGIDVREVPGAFNTDLGARGFRNNYSITRQYDGVAMGLVSSCTTFPFDSWTAERVEALHGPASVLYGHGAIGGAINVVPKVPLEKFQTEMLFSYGTDDTVRIGAGNTGPITENLFYRADVSFNQSDGWQEDGDRRNLSGRVSLRWDATDDLSFILAHDHSDWEPDTSYGVPMINGELNESISEKNYNDDGAEKKFEDDWTTLKTRWQPSHNVKVSNITYYMDTHRRADEIYSYKYNQDTGLIDRSDEYSVIMDVEQYGTRLDITFDTKIGSVGNTFLVGADYSHYFLDRKDNDKTTAEKTNSVDPWNPMENSIDWDEDGELLNTYEVELDTLGLFAEDRISLTEKWTVVAGLRWENLDFEKKYGDYYTIVYNRHYDDKDFSTDGYSWSVGTVYQPVKSLSLYGHYAKGLDLDSSITSLDEEEEFCEGEQFELGIKQVLWNGKLQWTLSAYDLTKSNMLTRDPNDPSLYARIGEQSSRGVELSLFADLGSGVRVAANGTVLDAEYDALNYGGVSYAGKTPTGIAEEMANAHLYWSFHKNWDSRVSLKYVGDRYFYYDNDLKAPGYHTVDLGLSYKVTEAMTIRLNCYNIFDKYYAKSTYRSHGQYIPGDPRTFAVSAYWKF